MNPHSVPPKGTVDETHRPPKHLVPPGTAQHPPSTEDVHKQVKPLTLPARAPSPKPFTLPARAPSPKPDTAGRETGGKPPAQGAATHTGPADAKPAHSSKESYTGPPLTKAVTVPPATEPTLSGKKPTSGPTHTATPTVRPVLSGTTAAATEGQLTRPAAEKPATITPTTTSSNTTATAKAGTSGVVETPARPYVTASEQLGVVYPRATTLSEAVAGQVRMSEEMLDALQGGMDDALSLEPFAMARPSVPQVRYPTPYPPTPRPPVDSQQNGMNNIRDVDAIEVFKRRRSSVVSDVDTASFMQLATDRHAHRKSLKPKPETIDEEHLLSKGERPLRSSLRSETGSKRKKVKFCDIDGVELATVRLYFNQEEAPEVPLYATAYLKLDEMYDPIMEEQDDQKVLRPAFSQPGAAPDFMGRVHMNKVALEFCLVNDQEMNVTGTVRVANIAFNKSVTVRYTTDQWKNATEIKANYVYYSHDGVTDRFSFVIQLPTTFGPGQQLQFAVKYDAGVESFWDNNFGQNYKVECFTREMLQTAANSSYMSSLHPTFTWLQYL